MRIRTAIAAAAAVTVIGGATLAHAGYAWPGGEVSISRNKDGSGYAGGNLRVVRLSFDNVQSIGCTISAAKSAQRLDCNAQAANGVSAACTSTDAALIRTATAIQPDSQLLFGFDVSGYCTSLNVTMSSLTLH